MDEFALCWNNFQDNLTTGFQNLYNKNQMCDVTLACSGKLLKCHKLVLSICSPYFQEIFITNPCKHPIIILNVTYSVMEKLLQFMYQGEVNVKHTELQSFMKIAETLQIKGLTTSSQNKSQTSPNGNNHLQPPYYQHEDYQPQLPNNLLNINNNNIKINTNINNSNIKQSGKSDGPSVTGLKRTNDYLVQQTETFPGTTTSSTSSTSSIYPKQKSKRLSLNEENDPNLSTNDSMDNLTAADDVFLPPIPQISMLESSRFDVNNIKRESTDSSSESPSSNKMGSSMRNAPGSTVFNFDYNNIYANKSAIEYPNEMQLHNDYNKNNTQHMDIPSGSNITMLSSTSLLNGNCVFNRNNTVATQQGMKTYWLCKSYRITMCRARCITHQGRILSATGVHNHQPHMKTNQNSPVHNVDKNVLQTSTATPTTNSICINTNLVKSIPASSQLAQQGHHIPTMSPSNLHLSQPNVEQQQQQEQHQHQHPQQQHHILNREHHPTGNSSHQDPLAVHNMMQNVNILSQQQNLLPVLSTTQQIQGLTSGSIETSTLNDQNLDSRTVHMQQHQSEQQHQYLSNMHQQHQLHHQQMSQNNCNTANALVDNSNSINISNNGNNNNNNAIIVSTPRASAGTPTAASNTNDNCNIMHRTATLPTSSGA